MLVGSVDVILFANSAFLRLSSTENLSRSCIGLRFLCCAYQTWTTPNRSFWILTTMRVWWHQNGTCLALFAPQLSADLCKSIWDLVNCWRPVILVLQAIGPEPVCIISAINDQRSSNGNRQTAQNSPRACLGTSVVAALSAKSF